MNLFANNSGSAGAYQQGIYNYGASEVKDPRTDARLDFVGGIHGTKVLEEKVHSGQAAAAFSLPAVSLSQILAVADADQIMPLKSTWFEPKLRSGFYIHKFN